MSPSFASRSLAVAAIPMLFAGIAMGADRPDPPKVIEEIIAKINGDIVTRGQLAEQRVLAEKALRGEGISGATLNQALQRFDQDGLREEIDKILLVQKAKELDIKVDDELKKEIAAIQADSKQSDPDKFHEWVRQIAGMPYEDFYQQKKNTLLQNRVVGEEVYRNIVIPQTELQKYYDEHKSEFIRKESVTLRAVLVSVGDGKPASVAAAEKKATGLLERARAGTDKFPDLARQNSDDPSAEDDGLLPPFEKGSLNKSVEDVVFQHEKGYITDLIRVGAGFEFLKIEDHTPAGQATLDEVKNQVSEILMRPKAEPKIREYLTTLRQRAYLQIKPGYVDSGAAPGQDTTWKDPARLLPETTTKAAVANQRHLKKLFGVIPYKMTGVKDTAPATPNVTPIDQKARETNSDGTPRQ